ncbi:hypothetical protein JTE90_011277 [Oedothorax gibbosus]|uniref:C2H2-type domain-containing protein n=1 Tax=Oedothorax gibbosus TaxID=931172 RepID=A0AAV6TXA5_9ARAC|nr:hypothetical protein JTE90_011277 [Oedothorax gibbosus]
MECEETLVPKSPLGTNNSKEILEDGASSCSKTIPNSSPEKRSQDQTKNIGKNFAKKPRKYNFGCNICTKSYHCISRLEKHLKTHDFGSKTDENSPKGRPNTALNSGTFVMSQNNKPAINSDKPFTCNICGVTYKGERCFNKHVASHASLNIDTTNTKDVVQRQRKRLRNTEVNKTKVKKITKPRKRHSCNICSKSYHCPSRLDKHLLIHTSEGLIIEKPDYSFKCDICNKFLSSKRTLKAHKETHETLTKNHKCKECGHLFARADSLRIHMQVHTSTNRFTCDICSKVFAQRRYLLRHMRNHNKNNLYRCNLCDKTYIDKRNFTAHYRKHTDERPFTCDHCGRSFYDQNALNMHLPLHTGIKPHQCTICDKKYIYKSSLRSHYLTHTQEKPHACDICHRKFSEKNNLKRHYLLHTNMKPHICSVCGKGFTHSNSLKSHVQTHVTENLLVEWMDQMGPQGLADPQMWIEQALDRKESANVLWIEQAINPEECLNPEPLVEKAVKNIELEGKLE